MYPKVTFALPFPNIAKLSSVYKLNQSHHLDCEQALWSHLAVGQEKEGRLATMSLEFEYLHWKSRCECWLDDISNYIIILGMCFSMFAYISTDFCFTLIGGNLTAQSTGNHRWTGGGMNSNSRGLRSWLWLVASSSSFSHPAARAPWRACSQACHHMVGCESG